MGSWLQGPRAAAGVELGYPGQRLGLPERGPGSVARFGRRLAAIVVDWLLCELIALGLLGAALGDPTRSGELGLKTLVVFAAENLLLVGTLGSTVGHRLLGLQVVRADTRGYAGPVRAAVRTLLLCLLVPALVWDRDQRGLHDKVARTVLVRR